MSPQTANVPTALTANAFTRTGYTFSGWNTAANGSGTAYADGATYSFSADITLYAQWTRAAEPHRDLQRQRRHGHDESADRQRPDGPDGQHLHADGLHVQRLEHGCQWLGHALCRRRDLLLQCGHHAVRPVDGAADPHRDLQRQRRHGHDESADRQRADGPDGQRLHARRATSFSGWNTAANGSGTPMPTARPTPSARTSRCTPSGQRCRTTP